MRGNHVRLLEILSSDGVGFFHTVEFNWNSNHFYTDLGRDLSFDGKLFFRDNPVVGIDNIRYSNVIDRELFSIQLSGLEPSIISEIDTGITNLPVTVNRMFTINGVVQSGLDDKINIYKGFVSSSSESTTEESKLFTIQCTAPLSNLDETSTIFTTKSGMLPFNPDDTCFDSVYEGSETRRIRWGRN